MGVGIILVSFSETMRYGAVGMNSRLVAYCLRISLRTEFSEEFDTIDTLSVQLRSTST